MRITLVAVGRMKAGAAQDLYELYARRLRWPIAVKEVEERRALPPEALKEQEGALLLANFLLEPATQARAQDIQSMGSVNVLDLARLPPADRALFDQLTPSEALPTPAELGKPLLEPHASWMTRIAAEWQRRYTQ